MRMKSVAGLICYVNDIDRTTKFYTDLGFVVKEQTVDKLSVALNWFWMDFHAQGAEENPEFQQEAKAEPKGAGLYIYVSVDDVDEFYQGLLDKGFRPSSEPRDWPWGNREFALRDPDGYKLIFFKRN